MPIPFAGSALDMTGQIQQTGGRIFNVQFLVFGPKAIQHIRSEVQVKDGQISAEIGVGPQAFGRPVHLDSGRARSGGESLQRDPTFRAMPFGFDLLQRTRQLGMPKFAALKLPMKTVAPGPGSAAERVRLLGRPSVGSSELTQGTNACRSPPIR